MVAAAETVTAIQFVIRVDGRARLLPSRIVWRGPIDACGSAGASPSHGVEISLTVLPGGPPPDTRVSGRCQQFAGPDYLLYGFLLRRGHGGQVSHFAAWASSQLAIQIQFYIGNRQRAAPVGRVRKPQVA
ncbi:MAG: hypothetical protein JWN70_6204 [Planctomycetaceae bacterium]|nr:hypothetical protein [Planctomycetaceae bacterium]